MKYPLEHCSHWTLWVKSNCFRLALNGTLFSRQQVHQKQWAKGEISCSAQVHGQGLPGINEQCLSRCDSSYIPRGQLLQLSQVDGADASALNGFNAQAGDSVSSPSSASSAKPQSRCAAASATESSEWPQPEKAWPHVDRHALKRVIVQRQTEARAHQSKRPKLPSQEQMQQQQ